MSDYLVTPSITKKQDEKPNLTQSHHTNTHSDSLPAPTPHLATNPTSNHVDTSHTYHIPYQSSLEDGFMFPHEDIYIKNAERIEQELLSTTLQIFDNINESHDLLRDVNNNIIPNLSKQLVVLSKSTPQVQRIQKKMIQIFSALRKMRKELVQAGVVIEGEIDQVEEIDRRDREELLARKNEYLARKKAEKEAKEALEAAENGIRDGQQDENGEKLNDSVVE